MAHLMKNTKVNCPNLIRHFERNKDIKEYSNENIDLSKSHLNYNLAPVREEGQFEFIKERCSEVKCLNRADVKVMANWVVTLPKDIKPDEENKFFKDTYEFLKNRYGGQNEENIISAYVHNDEKTPHMHFAFVPVAYDKNKSIYKVSAKEVLNRNDLRSFHSDLDKYLSKTFNRNIGVVNGVTRDGNLSIQDMKRGTTAKALVNMDLNLNEKVEKLNVVVKELTLKTQEIKEKEKQIEDLKVEIEALKKANGQSKRIFQTVNDIPRGKQVMGKVILSKGEWSEMYEQSQGYCSEKIKSDDLTRENNNLSFRVENLEKENKQLRLDYNKTNLESIKFTNIANELKMKNLELTKKNNLYVNFINDIPKEIKIQLPLENLINARKNVTSKYSTHINISGTNISEEKKVSKQKNTIKIDMDL